MTCKLPILGTIGAAALMLSTGVAHAQSRLDQTQLSGAPPPSVDIRMVDGKVVELERHRDMVTMLKLDNGATLTVPPEATGPGGEAKIGDAVVARYVENGGAPVATLLRVIEMQAP
jgi:hypothetical protein